MQVRTCTQARWRGRAAEGWYVSASCVARIGPFGALKDQPRHSNVDGGPEAGGGGRTPRSAGCTVAGIPGIPVACAASPTAHGARIGGSASGLPPPTAHGAAAGGQTNRAPQSDLEKDHDGTLRHAARTPRCCRSTNDARVDPQRNERQTDTLIVRVLTLHGRQGRAKSSSHLNAGRKKPTVVQKFRKCRQTFGTVSRGSRGRNRHKAGPGGRGFDRLGHWCSASLAAWRARALLRLPWAVVLQRVAGVGPLALRSWLYLSLVFAGVRRRIMTGSAHMLRVLAGLMSSLSLSPAADAFVFQLQPPAARLAQPSQLCSSGGAHRRPALCTLPPRLATCGRASICRLRLSDSMDDMKPEEAMVERLLERLENGIESAVSQERFKEASALRDEISRMHMDDTSSVLRVSGSRERGRAHAGRALKQRFGQFIPESAISTTHRDKARAWRQ